MINWLHHFFNPHCPDCLAEAHCKSCDVLRELLEAERYNNKQLLASLLEQVNPKPIAQTEEGEIRLPLNYNIPWRVRQQMLEQEDRKKAQLIAEKQKEEIENKKSTEQLEKELLGEENAK